MPECPEISGEPPAIHHLSHLAHLSAQCTSSCSSVEGVVKQKPHPGTLVQLVAMPGGAMSLKPLFISRILMSELIYMEPEH